MEIQSIIIPQTSTQTVPNIYTPNWLQSEPVVPFPLVPITQQVGVPVIQYQVVLLHMNQTESN